MKVNIDFWRIKADAEQKVFDAVNESLDLAKAELESRTPEDKKKLVKWYKKIKPTKTGDVISWKIENKVKYWIYVEYWVWGRKFNYHKPKWKVFYKGIWARMLTKTKDHNLEKFRKLFFIKLKWGK